MERGAEVDAENLWKETPLQKAAEIGKSLLMAAVNISYIPAIHAYGVNLLNGWKPFIKDINLAKQCFIQCYKEKKYLPSMLNLALILQAYENNPEKAFLILNELVEYSFLLLPAAIRHPDAVRKPTYVTSPDMPIITRYCRYSLWAL